jgi:nicotinamide mononucleotide transporter PnuC
MDIQKYFQFGLQIFFLIQSFIGFLMWSDTKDKIKKMTTTDKYRFAGFVILCLFMLFYLNFSIINILEVIIAISSIIATFLLMKRKSVSWMMWTVVNIQSIIYFYLIGMYVSVFLYIIFLINSVFAFYKWEEEQ